MPCREPRNQLAMRDETIGAPSVAIRPLFGARSEFRDSALNLAGVLRIDRRQFHAERRRRRLNRRKLVNPGG
jgi:hypothetical protein